MCSWRRRSMTICPQQKFFFIGTIHLSELIEKKPVWILDLTGRKVPVKRSCLRENTRTNALRIQGIPLPYAHSLWKKMATYADQIRDKFDLPESIPSYAPRRTWGTYQYALEIISRFPGHSSLDPGVTITRPEDNNPMKKALPQFRGGTYRAIGLWSTNRLIGTFWAGNPVFMQVLLSFVPISEGCR